jgi:hypothetical protein
MKLGTYRHHKGKYYQVIGVAKHSETFEDLVAYYCLYPNKLSQLWVRPKKMFQEKVLVSGKKVPRFEYVSKES